MPGTVTPARGAPLLAALLAALAAGCASPGPRPVLALDPPVSAVAPGETVAFAATVSGSDEPVVWEVVEPGGGAIDERGRYTAPAREGTFHVTAWVGTPETLRTAEIRVRLSALARAAPEAQRGGRPPPFR